MKIHCQHQTLDTSEMIPARHESLELYISPDYRHVFAASGSPDAFNLLPLCGDTLRRIAYASASPGETPARRDNGIASKFVPFDAERRRRIGNFILARSGLARTALQ